VGNREYQIERKTHDHKEQHDESSQVCGLLQELHDERMDHQLRARKGDRLETTNNTTCEKVKVVGAIPVFSSKDEVIIVDHAYNKHLNVNGRDVVEQHHDRERNEHKKDKVLFGLFSGDHKERSITHDVAIDGKVSQFQERSREHTVKFLGITIAHSKKLVNDNDDDCKPRHVNPPRTYHGKGGW
jgi:hypothetical protein